MIERKPGPGWAFRPLLTSIESHRQSYRFRMVIEPAAILNLIDLLLKGERMEASQFLREHLNQARITKPGGAA